MSEGPTERSRRAPTARRHPAKKGWSSATRAFAVDQQTGEYTLLADRWHTCFFDLAGGQGLLGQVQGRTADDAAYWLAGATPAWRDAVRVVCIDLCSIYASAVRRMLPRAIFTTDLFHVVQLAGAVPAVMTCDPSSPR